nr:DUF6516 family protein [Halorubrum sp. BOL3-1]
MNDDVTVLEDEIEAYADGTVARVRVLSVPASDRFEDGIKYAYHYAEAGADDPIIRFENNHGVHELHLGGGTFEIDYPRPCGDLPRLAGGAPRREARRLVARSRTVTDVQTRN